MGVRSVFLRATVASNKSRLLSISCPPFRLRWIMLRG